MKKLSCLFLTVAVACVTTPSQANLVISQYYEGSSNNKWIEIFNAGASSYDLSTVSASVWSNANAEGYKSNGTPTWTATLSGTLASGGIFLLANPSAVLPAYATADFTSSTVIGFNGNDSFTLSTAGTFSTANLIDAIGMTDGGNEGANTSFVRTSLAQGYNTTAGSDVLDFAAVWQQVTNATVDTQSGTTTDIGVTSLTAVPEVSSFLFGGVAVSIVGFGFVRRRRTA